MKGRVTDGENKMLEVNHFFLEEYCAFHLADGEFICNHR